MKRIRSSGLDAVTLCVLCLPLIGLGDAAAQEQTETTSAGTIYVQNYRDDGQQNDSYQTQITGTINGVDLLFDETFFRSINDPAAQAFLMDAAEVRGFASNGAPGVLLWGAPELIDGWEEILDSFTETYTLTDPTVVVTTRQITSGDADNALVYYGERGTCYDTGANGSTNTPPFNGSFANCDFWEEYYVPPGTVNTNTHTSYIIGTTEVTFTQIDVLNFAHYQLTGEVVLIGTVYPALQTAAFESGSGFLSRLTAQADAGPTTARSTGIDGAHALRVWAEGHQSRVTSTADALSLGNVREISGGSGGLMYAPASGWRLGLALDHSDVDLAVRGAPETARAGMDQFGLHGGFEGGHWFVSAAAINGRGNVRLRHGNNALGGVADAEFDLSLWTAGVHAGYRKNIGDWQLTPMIGIEWSRLHTDSFVETGGIALRANDYSADRSSAWAGLELARRWDFGGGHALRALALSATARWHNVMSGRERTMPVAFASGPADSLLITGVSEPGNSSELQLAASFQFNAHAAIQLGAQALRNGDDRGQRVVAGLRIDW